MFVADELREPARRHVPAVVHLEEPVLRRDVALRHEQVVATTGRRDRRHASRVARDRDLGAQARQVQRARDLGQRAADDDEAGDDDADERDDEHHGDGENDETDEVTTRHASEGTSPPDRPSQRSRRRNVPRGRAVRIGTRTL